MALSKEVWTTCHSHPVEGQSILTWCWHKMKIQRIYFFYLRTRFCTSEYKFSGFLKAKTQHTLQHRTERELCCVPPTGGNESTVNTVNQTTSIMPCINNTVEMHCTCANVPKVNFHHSFEFSQHTHSDKKEGSHALSSTKQLNAITNRGAESLNFSPSLNYACSWVFWINVIRAAQSCGLPGWPQHMAAWGSACLGPVLFFNHYSSYKASLRWLLIDLKFGCDVLTLGR